MQTSYFQLSLLLGMAAALGATVSSSPAIGYPAAPTISTGSNPIWNVGGVASGTMTFTAPSDQDIVITDILFGSRQSGVLEMNFTLGGETVAAFAWREVQTRQPISLQTGIRIPAGETLTVSSDHSYSFGHTRYTFTGYYAQP